VDETVPEKKKIEEFYKGITPEGNIVIKVPLFLA